MPLAIAKTLLPDTATFYLALGRVFGLGKSTGLAIAEEVGISKEARVMDVKAGHVRQVRWLAHLCCFACCPWLFMTPAGGHCRRQYML